MFTGAGGHDENTGEQKKKKIVKDQRLITWEVFIARKRGEKMRKSTPRRWVISNKIPSLK